MKCQTLSGAASVLDPAVAGPILDADYLPLLPDDPGQINHPVGGLAVRYLYNKLEDIHPFIDNVKPITRYVRLALKTRPI